MRYTSFASYYDKMMSDVDYNWWISNIKQYIKKDAQVLDLACGTGTLTTILANAEYNMTGLDISEDMLVIASEKIKDLNVKIDLIHRDMRDLDGLTDFDAVVCAVDSINYLTCIGDVQQTFNSVYNILNHEGFFIFDVHTPYKINNIFNDYLYVENDEDLTYIWYVNHDELPLSIVHELTLFAKNSDGSYNRNVEYHYQRTFEMSDYVFLLQDAGFTIVDQIGDNERQMFIVRKD